MQEIDVIILDFVCLNPSSTIPHLSHSYQASVTYFYSSDTNTQKAFPLEFPCAWDA